MSSRIYVPKVVKNKGKSYSDFLKREIYFIKKLDKKIKSEDINIPLPILNENNERVWSF